MRPGLTLEKAAGRLEQIEQSVADGRWQLNADTMSVVLRHTVGILTALQASLVVGAQASS